MEESDKLLESVERFGLKLDSDRENQFKFHVYDFYKYSEEKEDYQPFELTEEEIKDNWNEEEILKLHIHEYDTQVDNNVIQYLYHNDDYDGCKCARYYVYDLWGYMYGDSVLKEPFHYFISDFHNWTGDERDSINVYDKKCDNKEFL